MSGRGSVLVAAGLVVLAGCVFGGELSHVVRSGESASSIARRYYGDYDKAEELLRYNGRRGTVIRAGESLRVPFCDEHIVRPGDTWSVLAQRYLGAADRYPAVAALNGLPVEAPLRVGQRIVFPVVLGHRLERGESLAALAERFYGDPELARVLGGFNGIEDPRRLAVGQAVEIPLVDLRLREGARKEAPPAAPARAASGTAASPPPVAPDPALESSLGAASTALGEARYERALEILDEIRGPVATRGTDDERIRLWHQLATLYVAFGRQAEACAAYRELGEPEDRAEQDPDLVSPKVLTILERCASGS